jgi:hypothetical protein
MMTARRRAEAVRLEVPRLEPDDAFVERLADAARASRPSTAARRPLQGLRVGLAAAGVVGLTVGGAWAAGSLVEREDQAPGRSPATPSNAPISPDASPSAELPSTPIAPSSRPVERDHDKSRPDRPGERGHDHGKHVGRPDEHPGKGLGRDHGTGQPPGAPAPGEPGVGADKRNERADPGGPKGSGGGRPADSPR